MHRKSFLKGLLLLPAVLAVRLQAATQVTVYKTPTCGCCGKWVEHMKASGFAVTVEEVDNTGPYREKYGVPEALQSCHTAVVEGYAIEGHVPAPDIQRLLKERTKAKGLAVPGMVSGSPGMEGGRTDAYSVLLFQADGRSTVYQSYPRK